MITPHMRSKESPAKEATMPDSKAKIAWVKSNTVPLHIRFNKHTDADIIKKLDSVDSKQGYIKELIRKDLQPRQ